MISLADMPLPIGRKKGSVSHTSHKHKTGVQLFGSSEGCTPALFYHNVDLLYSICYTVEW